MNQHSEFADATGMLNLIPTTPMMIAYHQNQHENNKASLENERKLNLNPAKIKTLEKLIGQSKILLASLRELPNLENDLLLRRARNYEQSDRYYEAFWMYHGLMTSTQDSKEIEIFTYSCFANALKINKLKDAIEIALNYKKAFPTGEYINVIIPGLVSELVRSGNASYEDQYLELSYEFIEDFPNEAATAGLLNVWASYHIQHSMHSKLIKQHRNWIKRFAETFIEDGLHYWKGVAEMQLGKFHGASKTYKTFNDKYSDSIYYSEALINKGTAQFYTQKYAGAKKDFTTYIEDFPENKSIDQAHYYLGEIAAMESDYVRAIEHFQLADQFTQSQTIHDAAAFGIGIIYVALNQQQKRLEHYQSYIKRFGAQGRLTDATIEVGESFIALGQSTAMLTFYRDFISNYTMDSVLHGVDAIIESYAEVFPFYKNQLDATIEFFEQLKADTVFRENMTTDRALLFEHFYYNNAIDPALYHKLRAHRSFNSNLSSDLNEIQDLTLSYYDQSDYFKREDPLAYFKNKLKFYQSEGSRIAATRMLMGLYRSGETLNPEQPFDIEFVQTLTPRLLLYVADYSRGKKSALAESAWQTLLDVYPKDETAIVAHLRMATLKENRNQLAAAIEHLEVIEKNFSYSPQLPAVLLRQGELLTKMKQYNAARKKYEYILKVPDWRGEAHARALYQTGKSYFAEEKFAEAHGYFERTFLAYSQFTDWSARAYLADADVLIALGSKADALATLKEAIETLPENTETALLESIKSKIIELQPVAPHSSQI